MAIRDISTTQLKLSQSAKQGPRRSSPPRGGAEQQMVIIKALLSLSEVVAMQPEPSDNEGVESLVKRLKYMQRNVLEMAAQARAVTSAYRH